MTRYSIRLPGSAAYAHTDDLGRALELQAEADQSVATGHIVRDNQAGAVVASPRVVSLQTAPPPRECEECDEVTSAYRVLVEGIGQHEQDRRVLHEIWICGFCAERCLPEWAL